MSSPSPLDAVRRDVQALRDAGDLDSARGLLAEALEAARPAFGEDHPEILGLAHQLGRHHREAGDPAAARRVLEEAIAAGERRYGDADALILGLSFDLGAVAEELGNRHEASRNFGRVARFGPAVLGADHWAVRAARAYLGDDAPAPAGWAEPGEATAAPQAPTTSAPTPVAPQVPPVPAVPATPAVLPVPATLPVSTPQALPAPPPIPTPPAPPVTAVPPLHAASSVPPVAPPPTAQAGRARVDGSPPRDRSAAAPPPPAHRPAPAVPAVPPGVESLDTPGPYPDRAAGRAVPYPAPEPQPAPPPALPLPPAPVAAGRSRAPVVVAVAAAVVAAVSATVTAVMVLRDDDPPPSPPAVTAPTAAPALDGEPPTGVRVRDDGTAITVTWEDPGSGTVPFVVAGGRAGQQLRAMATIDPGETSHTVNGLNPRLDYCFTVLAVYSTQQYATSGQVCTDRGGPSPG